MCCTASALKVDVKLQNVLPFTYSVKSRVKLEAASMQQHSPSDVTDPFSDSDIHAEDVCLGDSTEDYSPSHEADNDDADHSDQQGNFSECLLLWAA